MVFNMTCSWGLHDCLSTTQASLPRGLLHHPPPPPHPHFPSYQQWRLEPTGGLAVDVHNCVRVGTSCFMNAGYLCMHVMIEDSRIFLFLPMSRLLEAYYATSYQGTNR